MKKTILFMVIVFIAGWCVNSAYSQISYNNLQDTDQIISLKEGPTDDTLSQTITDTVSLFFNEPPEQISPFDHIKESEIHVFKDRIIIDIKDAEWARFTDTNSMDPVIDADSHAIEIKPTSVNQIHEGDIVSYKSKYAEGTIIHRVVEIGEDEEGWFCRMKGDNNKMQDPGKIRFEQIQRVVVAIIY
ncbi:MAG: hypothetical protein U9R34_08770 [Nanoarchaeota archaeon]|nr:hypothetical protein [Nanoarchaeota archaeon]